MMRFWLEVPSVYIIPISEGDGNLKSLPTQADGDGMIVAILERKVE